jgi:hypothetical protein
MMKSRRLTILCVSLVALAGTPRAWQEAGKLLSAIQHKAQVMFWSQVLQPKARESSVGSELVASARAVEMSPAGVDSNCPLNHVESRDKQAAANSKAGRRVASASVQSKASARAQGVEADSLVAPNSHADLIAGAYKALRENSSVDQLRRLERIQERRGLSGIAMSRPAPPALPAVVTSALPHPSAANKTENFKFVMIPAISPVASALVEKENVVQFRMLRKTIEDSKLMRQKNRLPLSRGAAAFPSI